MLTTSEVLFQALGIEQIKSRASDRLLAKLLDSQQTNKQNNNSKQVSKSMTGGGD